MGIQTQHLRATLAAFMGAGIGATMHDARRDLLIHAAAPLIDHANELALAAINACADPAAINTLSRAMAVFGKWLVDIDYLETPERAMAEEHLSELAVFYFRDWLRERVSARNRVLSAIARVEAKRASLIPHRV